MWELWDGTRMRSLVKLMITSNFTNQQEKLINVICNQINAQTRHGLIQNHKIHPNHDYGGVTIFLPTTNYVNLCKSYNDSMTFFLGFLKWEL
jgi:hypothetical protein